MKKVTIILLAGLIFLLGATALAYNEAPMLRIKVAAGELPPVEERLPENPVVMEPWEEIGKYGGTLRIVTLSPNFDETLRHANDAPLLELPPDSGYHRYNPTGAEIHPGIFDRWEMSEDGKVWTFRITKGLKWSDGIPVTTEDVRYTIEDVYYNKEIYPAPPELIQWGGETAELEIMDDYTFRLKLAKSYGLFLPNPNDFGRTWGLLVSPSHYLKQFHVKYTPLDKLEPVMKEYGYSKEEWGRFYNFMHPFGNDGAIVLAVGDPVKYPVLSPWRVASQPKPEEWILERNPYYYKVDPQGNQLPYIDRIHLSVVGDREMITMKILTGEVHIEGGYSARLSDYPLFMENREKGSYEVMLLRDWLDQPLIYFLNLCPEDLVLREIVQDVRFRQALSLALDREDIRESIFLGFGRPAQWAPVPGSVFYEEEFEKAYAQYNPEKANALLDEMGLKWDENHEYRLRPDGERLTLAFVYYEVFPSVTPGAELAHEYWEEIGIRVPVKLVDNWWTLWSANQTVVADWGDSASVLPNWFAAGLLVTTPLWFEWYNSGGEAGVEPIPAAKRLYEMRDRMYSTSSEEERMKAAKELFRLQAENLWVIGTVTGVPVPVIYSKKLGNISVAEEKDYYNITVLEAGEQWFFKE